MRGFLLVFSLHFHDEHPGGDKWFSADKAKHFFTAAFVQSASYGGVRALRASQNSSLAAATAVATATPLAQVTNAALDSLTTEAELEPLLKAANILLSAGDEQVPDVRQRRAGFLLLKWHISQLSVVPSLSGGGEGARYTYCMS